jgi:hypothetical protein
MRMAIFVVSMIAGFWYSNRLIALVEPTMPLIIAAWLGGSTVTCGVFLLLWQLLVA